MSVAFLYPGQGAQFTGMLHQLPNHPKVNETLIEASQVLGHDIFTLDTETALSSTVPVQLGLFVCGVAVTRALQTEGIKPEVVTGLSVGAFAAAVAARAVSFKDGLNLVKLRAELMEKAYPKGYGLSVVIGLNEQQLSEIVREINKPESPVFIANLNAPTRIVIAGSDAAMEGVFHRAKDEGAHTTRRLRVSVPSHCALLESVAGELTRRMTSIEVRMPEVTYIDNRRARPVRDPDVIREDLATNIAHAVRWHDATTVAYERGVRLFVELPPGQILSDLASTAFPEARSIALGQMQIDAAVKLIKRRAERTA
ncbi:MAG TPA: malonate decarboxylase subunit epsilon [Chthoniobacterales bacterium]|nr:malonate decarboxylase subunit epsilon [Chthoniobacterales bacterium]